MNTQLEHCLGEIELALVNGDAARACEAATDLLALAQAIGPGEMSALRTRVTKCQEQALALQSHLAAKMGDQKNRTQGLQQYRSVFAQ